MTVIPPKSGRVFEVNKGEVFRVRDIDGCQVADFVCFNLHDHDEAFSQGNTRNNACRLRITKGDHLYSNLNNVMFDIIEDTVGIHDLLYPPCNRFIYELLGVGSITGCQENLEEALAPFGIQRGQVPMPFNIFMNTEVNGHEQEMVVRRPRSSPGDYIDLRATIDCLVGLTACAAEIFDCNGDECTAIDVQVL